ncbi:hypothetical protein [Actinophytocola sp.]|uniref:hypothetical protein n=1 Tax=Actinophytocola sp. TaxID=1872138 RepID=UPI003D6B182D
MRWLLSAGVGVAVLVAGCTAEPATDPSRTSEATTAAPPPPTPPDKGPRPVTMPFGDGIGYVRPETAAQAICQAIPAQRWWELHGGPVGRTVENQVDDATCVVASGALSVRLAMAQGHRGHRAPARRPSPVTRSASATRGRGSWPPRPRYCRRGSGTGLRRTRRRRGRSPT